MSGRSQADVAREAGLSRQYVSNVVRNTNARRRRSQLKALLDVLDIDLDAYDTDPSEQPQPWTLPQKFNRVPNADRTEAEHMLEWILAVRERSLENHGRSAAATENDHDRTAGE